MRLLVLTVSLLGACSGPTKPETETVGNLATVRHKPYCPSGNPYFNAELFPGCQDLPFGGGLTLCKGKACDRPCGAKHSWSGMQFSGDETLRFDYGPHGFTGSTKDGKPELSCTYDNGKRTSCSRTGGNTLTAVRDANGRITKITGDKDDIDITYNGAGHVTKLGKSDFEYDAQGKLVKIGDRVLEWDDRGRVIGEKWTNHTIAIDYDDQDRITRVTVTEGDLSSQRRTTEIAYEEGRIEEIRSSQLDSSDVTEYLYICP
jgi:YD repeat-containing protein